MGITLLAIIATSMCDESECPSDTVPCSSGNPAHCVPDKLNCKEREGHWGLTCSDFTCKYWSKGRCVKDSEKRLLKKKKDFKNANSPKLVCSIVGAWDINFLVFNMATSVFVATMSPLKANSYRMRIVISLAPGIKVRFVEEVGE